MESRKDGTILDRVETLFRVGTASGLSDAQLLDRFALRGDAAEVAFAALVGRHGPMVFRVSRGILRDPHDAEDAFQATFLILALKAATIRDRGSVASWLFGTARRVAIRARAGIARRSDRERRAAALAGDRWRMATPPEPIPEVREEVDRLPEKYREAIILCDLGGLTHEEAAGQLRLPVGTVKVRLARGRERLRGRLARRGLAPTLVAAALSGQASAMMPTPLMDGTIKIARSVAEGRAVVASASVAALVRGVLRAMILNKLKTAVAALAAPLVVIVAAAMIPAVLPRPARSAQVPAPPPARAEGPAPRADDPAAVGKAREVTIDTLKKTDLRRSTVQAGSVQAFESVELYPKVSGYLKTLAVDIGDTVRRGQVLAEIDAPELDADLEKSRGMVRQSKAKSEKAKHAVLVMKAKLATAQAEVGSAEVAEKQAEEAVALQRKQLDRIQALIQRQAVEQKIGDEAQGRFDAAASGVAVAKSRTLSARAALGEAEARLMATGGDLEEARADIEIAEAGLRKAMILRDYARITSPIDGIVNIRAHHVGDYVRSASEAGSAPMLGIINTGKVRVVFAVPESDVPLLAKGANASFRIPALGGRTYRGKVARTAFALDPASRTLRAEVDLDNADGSLRQGYYGQLTIDLPSRSGVLTIPLSAIFDQTTSADARCYRIKDGRAAPAQIKVGGWDEGRVEVLDGLKEGDPVVANAAGISEGDPIGAGGKGGTRQD